MKITELLKPESIALGVKASSKDEIIDCLTGLMEQGGRLNDRAGYKEGILARAALGSTAIGEGIAIPHAKVAAVKEPGLAAVTVPEGVDYEAFDGSLANLIFMIAAPDGEADTHLEALSKLSTLLMNPGFKDALIAAKTKEEFLQIIDDTENARYAKKQEEQVSQKSQGAAAQKDAETEPMPSQSGYRVLAVTACPTGIAHTYMAAENLENLGRKLGKPLIQVPVAEGIHHGEELIKKAVSGTVPVYHHSGNIGESERGGAGSGDSLGRQIYKHLMNGVSHMLPFVIGGGILIALAFLFDDYEMNPANFGKNTPLAAYLKTVGEQAFGMMLPVLAGYIAMSIADRPGLAAGFVGGLVAKMGMTFGNPAGGDVNAGFLGALFAGFAAGYILVGLRKLLSKLPKSLEGIKPVLLYPVLGVFITAVVTTFINPYVGMINDALTNALNSMGGTSRVILGMVVAGMMSVDMGGPVNKAAYVFGTAQLAEGNFEVMAAVMAGGMVPPLVIALCSTFFKKKFTEKDRQSGLVNYIMGLSFITEGVIPFAAQDPLRVIPSCVIGSAAAGGLSMFLGCTLRAPHGGLFVLPTIGNPLGYLAAVLIGSVIGCIILAALKKNIEE